MVANVLSGTQTSKEIREALKVEVAELKAKHPSFRPKLVIVQVGGREDSNVYIRQKIKAAADVGVDSEHVKFPREVTEADLLAGVEKLNADPTVHGIIVQLPLDCVAKIDGGEPFRATESQAFRQSMAALGECPLPSTRSGMNVGSVPEPRDGNWFSRQTAGRVTSIVFILTEKHCAS